MTTKASNSVLQLVSPAVSNMVLLQGTLDNVTIGANVRGPGNFTSVNISNPLSVANGGTGANTITIGSVLVGNGTNPVSLIPPGTAGYVLTSNGPGIAPSFAAIPAPADPIFTSTTPGDVPASGGAIINFLRADGNWAPIPQFTSTTPGDVPSSGGGNVNFLRADGVWATPTNGLTSRTDFYVATTGSDISGDGSAGNPWRNISHAIATIQTYAFAGYTTISIHVANGVYTESGSNSAIGLVPIGPIAIVGAGSANTTIHSNGVGFSCFSTNSSTGLISVTGCTLISDSAYCLLADGGGSISVNNDVIFQGAGLAHIAAAQGGAVSINASYTINGNSGAHWHCDNGTIAISAGISIGSSTVPAFSTAFAVATDTSFINASSVNFTLTTVGARFTVSANSVIQTQGHDPATYFPGNAPGTQTTGGIWQ